MRYTHLFTPFNIGSLNLKNRLVMSPMTMNYATEEGLATRKLIAHYVERARGGVGLIFVEGTFFDAAGRGYRNQLGISSEAHADALRPLTEAVHRLGNGAKIFLQIHHAGWRASSKITGLRPLGPSAVPAYAGGEVPHALSAPEIEGLIHAHVEAAIRASGAGFDGVDIHCAHGYLIPSFLSPLSNRRTDGYGGSLEARARFLLEIVRSIKGRLGRDFPLTIKISGDEFIAGGLGRDEMIEVARMAQEAGIDGLTVSAGSIGGEKIGDLSCAHQVLRTLPMMTDRCCLVPLAHEFKKRLSVPVITVGRINTPALAEEILANGRADLVAMGRPLLADPHLPQKAFDGREGEIRPCISCNEGCYKRIFLQKDIRCAVNPTLGRETEQHASKSPDPKRVVVVGGGPAGLEAAHAARMRGHEVVLIEKEGRLGGQLGLAAAPPGRQEIARFRDYQIRRLENSGVEIVLGNGATPEGIRNKRPGAVILATGATPVYPEIPGLHPSRRATGWEILSDVCGEPKGAFLVLGAGLVGCETADYLAHRGCKVSLVEMLPGIAEDADADTRAYLTMRFGDLGVEVFTNARLLRVEGDQAVVATDGKETRIRFDTMVFAVGVKADDRLEKALEGCGFPVIPVGDCRAPRRIMDAVAEGFQAGETV